MKERSPIENRRKSETAPNMKERPAMKTGLTHERRLQGSGRQASNARSPGERVLDTSERVQGKRSPRKGTARSPSVPVLRGSKPFASASVPVPKPLETSTEEGGNNPLRESVTLPIQLPSSILSSGHDAGSTLQLDTLDSPIRTSRAGTLIESVTSTPSHKPRSATSSLCFATADSALKKSEELLAEMLAAVGGETPKFDGKRRTSLMSLDSVPESVLSLCMSVGEHAEATNSQRTTVEVPIALLDMLTETWSKYREMTATEEASAKEGQVEPDAMFKEEFANLKRDLDLALLHRSSRDSGVASPTASETWNQKTATETWNQISALRKQLGYSSAGSICSTGATTSMHSPSFISLSSLSRSQGASCNSPISPISRTTLSSPPRRFSFDSSNRANDDSTKPPCITSRQISSETAVTRTPRRSLSPESWCTKNNRPDHSPGPSTTPRRPLGGAGPLPPRPSRILQQTSVPAIVTSGIPRRVPALEFKNITRPSLPGSLRGPLMPSSSAYSSAQLSSREVVRVAPMEEVLQGSIRVPIVTPREVKTPRVVSPRDVGASRALSPSPSGSSLVVQSPPVPGQFSPRQGGRTPRLLSRARVTQTFSVTSTIDTYAM